MSQAIIVSCCNSHLMVPAFLATSLQTATLMEPIPPSSCDNGTASLRKTSSPLKVTEDISFRCCSCTYVTRDQRGIVLAAGIDPVTYEDVTGPSDICCCKLRAQLPVITLNDADTVSRNGTFDRGHVHFPVLHRIHRATLVLAAGIDPVTYEDVTGPSDICCCESEAQLPVITLNDADTASRNGSTVAMCIFWSCIEFIGQHW
ncbi:uncharacterized protein LOC115331988 [Ixodes scapularis]|uniref:uncharacterized protein LOC115331988 n=1 Tax=Ixodes scapularis TaxID=6945 RepID=UPI001C37FE4F|nr:uncharacterized protein LOC115331988 [Ixodes scapularis]